MQTKKVKSMDSCIWDANHRSSDAAKYKNYIFLSNL